METPLNQPAAATAASPLPERPVVLRATGLKRAFGRVHAVEDLHLTVRQGEIYGFLGVNGAGKTTSIRMLMGIIKPDGGTIELLGQATRRTTIRQKQAIGYVSQEQTFYPWMTCRALGRFVGGFYPTWDAAEFDRLLRVLDVPPDRRVSQLSGGMKVKLALALALAPRPALLLLDEPTSGLDPVARREFLEIIQRQARDHQRTTFFSSHLVGEVERVADRVGIIHRGKMRYEGDLDTLRACVRLVRRPASESRPTLPPPLAAPVPIVHPVTSVSSAEVAGPLPPHPDLLPQGEEIPRPVPFEAGVPDLADRRHSDSLAPGERDEVRGTAAEQSPKHEGADSASAMPATATAPRDAFTLPPGFDVLRDETRDGVRSLVLHAPAAAWGTVELPDAEVRPLSLEDIFIALVGTPPASI